jgi:DNA-binding PadR family transcriptional regulator
VSQRAELPNTAWALLGLLSFGRELSGYDLKRWADKSIALFYWSPAPSQIYSELRRLEDLGLVEARAEPADNRRKRMFKITDRGTAELRDWLRTSDTGFPVLKHGTALRIWLGHLLEPDELRGLVEQHRRQMLSRAVEAEEVTAAAQRLGWQYPAVVTRWSQRYYQAQADLAQSLLDDLDALSPRADSQLRQ